MDQPDWIATCQKLWGDYWIEPLAECAGINRRTVERWKSGGGVPGTIRDALAQIDVTATMDRGWAMRVLADHRAPSISDPETSVMLDLLSKRAES